MPRHGIQEITQQIIRGYLIGSTGKSSEKGGRLIRDLLEERTESIINVHDKQDNMSRFKKFTGEGDVDASAASGSKMA